MRYTVLAALALIAAPAMAGDDASLAVTFTGIAAPQGRIMVALYDSEAAGAAGKPAGTAMVEVTGTGDVAARFTGLAPGHYGVKAFHDVDGNGRMNTNPFGIPTEPFAFSRDAVGERGPASWSAAGFDVAAGDNAQRITIR